MRRKWKSFEEEEELVKISFYPSENLESEESQKKKRKRENMKAEEKYNEEESWNAFENEEEKWRKQWNAEKEREKRRRYGEAGDRRLTIC